MKKQLLLFKARKLYRQYHEDLDRFSCGKELAEHISPVAFRLKTQFNETLDELAKIDPNCPTTRL